MDAPVHSSQVRTTRPRGQGKQFAHCMDAKGRLQERTAGAAGRSGRASGSGTARSKGSGLMMNAATASGSSVLILTKYTMEQSWERRLQAGRQTGGGEEEGGREGGKSDTRKTQPGVGTMGGRAARLPTCSYDAQRRLMSAIWARREDSELGPWHT